MNDATGKKEKWFFRIWEEGRHFDLWHANHFLVGIILGGTTIVYAQPFWVGFPISCVLILGWEYYEIFRGVKETLWNQVFDVVLGISGYLLFYHAYSYSDTELYFSIFSSAIVLWLFLEVWGFGAYLKRRYRW